MPSCSRLASQTTNAVTDAQIGSIMDAAGTLTTTQDGADGLSLRQWQMVGPEEQMLEFIKMDTNGDGAVSAEELAEALGVENVKDVSAFLADPAVLTYENLTEMLPLDMLAVFTEFDMDPKDG